MGRNVKIFLVLLFLSVVTFVVIGITKNADLPILNSQGTIANQQRDLLVFATLLMLVVVIPVYIMTILIAWRYRASNTKAKYSPNLTGNKPAEMVWWGIPMIIIGILAVVTWYTTHSLDPFKPIESDKKPLKVQVVALQWRWLFIYPEQKIAVINHVEMPEKTPVNFDITSDAPMNSFWIPSLGGQIYAMAGMNTKLHLMADRPGTYIGSSANISGEGFADMKFEARSSTNSDFNLWVDFVKEQNQTLDLKKYNELAKPTRNTKIIYFSNVEDSLYDKVVMKYMTPPGEDKNMHSEHMGE